jgi:hypothetical protein
MGLQPDLHHHIYIGIAFIAFLVLVMIRMIGRQWIRSWVGAGSRAIVAPMPEEAQV